MVRPRRISQICLVPILQTTLSSDVIIPGGTQSREEEYYKPGPVFRHANVQRHITVDCTGIPRPICLPMPGPKALGK